MATFTDLFDNNIAAICEYLDAATILALRRVNRDLYRKTKSSFYGLYSSVKVSFCAFSLLTLEKISLVDGIAKKVEHVTFGSETLDQYPHVVKALQGPKREELRTTYKSWLDAENHKGMALVQLIRKTLLRFPNLKSVRVEDRPSGQHAHNHQGYHPGLGSSTIKKLTGIDLRWNGPYPKPENPSDTRHSTFPSRSRQYVYAAVFILLRDLSIKGMQLDLDLVIGGYTDPQGKSYFTTPFDPSKALPRQAIYKNLKHFEIRDLDTDAVAMPYGSEPTLKDFLSKIAFDRIIFNGCRFRGEQLPNAFHGFDALELRDCTDVTQLDVVLQQHRHSFRSLTLSGIEMSTSYGNDRWGPLFRALCGETALSHLVLEHLKAGVSIPQASEPLEDNVPHIYAISWEGREGIMAGAQAMLAHLHNEGMPASPLLDLIDGHMAYLASKRRMSYID